MTKHFIDILRHRRSVRKFTGQTVSSEDLSLLKEAAVRSPSSRSFNPWRFVFIQDKNCILQLSQAKEHGAAFLKNAPLAIVVCGDISATNVWIEDCSIASIILQLTAEDLGLGSCWIQIRNRTHSENKTSNNYVKELLKLDDYLEVESIIALGYPSEKNSGHARGTLDWDKIIDAGGY